MPPDTCGVYRPPVVLLAGGTLARLSQIVGSGSRQRYWESLADLWTGVGPGLAQLDEFAAEPAELLDEDAPETLASLQYLLHAAGERAAGLRPPLGIAPLHAELAAAFGDARDATADVAAATEAGGAEGALPYVYEWRGALFRVRLARLRLLAPPTEAPVEPEDTAPMPRRAALSLLLILLGTAVLVAGAADGSWHVAVAGLASFALGTLVFDP
ncbi:MAG: hypothetical protein QOE36_3119 [Gaiellaceae bacterium]|nr:hypothetical protein [Gaiellaceae bacterium]